MARGEARRVCPFVRSSPSVFSSFILFLSSFSVPFFIFFYFVRSFQHVFFLFFFRSFQSPFPFFFFFRDATPFPLTLSRRLFSVSLLSPSFFNHPYTFFLILFFLLFRFAGSYCLRLLPPSSSSSISFISFSTHLFCVFFPLALIQTVFNPFITYF